MYYLFKRIHLFYIKDPDVDKSRPGPQHCSQVRFEENSFVFQVHEVELEKV